MTVELVLSIAVLACVALFVGSFRLLRSKGDAKRGWLMFVAALVLFANVLILAWP